MTGRRWSAGLFEKPATPKGAHGKGKKPTKGKKVAKPKKHLTGEKKAAFLANMKKGKEEAKWSRDHAAKIKAGKEKATQVMLLVHTQGKAVCGVYTRDIAETKAAQVNQYSSECEHPLLCEIERAD